MEQGQTIIYTKRPEDRPDFPNALVEDENGPGICIHGVPALLPQVFRRESVTKVVITHPPTGRKKKPPQKGSYESDNARGVVDEKCIRVESPDFLDASFLFEDIRERRVKPKFELGRWFRRLIPGRSPALA